MFFDFEDDRYTARYATDADADREEALCLGASRPDLAWIVTDRDALHRNPFYTGEPVPHPDDDSQESNAEWDDIPY